MKKRIFLIDTENVGLGSLYGAFNLTERDKIILFTSVCSQNTYSEKNIKKLNTKAKIQRVQVMNGKKNSLDFQLVAMLGLLIGQNVEADYYIVSKDNGYNWAIELLQDYSDVNISKIDYMFSLFEPDNTFKALLSIIKKQGIQEYSAFEIASIIKKSKNVDDAIKMIKMKQIFEVICNPDKYYKCINILDGFYNRQKEMSI